MRNLTFTVFLSFYLVSCSHALYCYQCGDGSPNGPCQKDLDIMIKDHAMHWKNNGTNHTSSEYTYRKQCPESENTCVIERVEVNGVVVAYIRDCSDGINFSINASRFQNFPQDKNITTCSYVEGKFFTCLSMCNTDLCNGPQAAPNTSSCSKTVPFWTMVFFVTMCLYL